MERFTPRWACENPRDSAVSAANMNARPVVCLQDSSAWVGGAGLDLSMVNVALSRCTALSHLALWKVGWNDWHFLTKLRYREKLLVWYKSYSNSGFFRPGPIVLPTAFTAAMHEHGLRGKHASSTKLKAICMRLGPWSKGLGGKGKPPTKREMVLLLEPALEQARRHRRGTLQRKQGPQGQGQEQEQAQEQGQGQEQE